MGMTFCARLTPDLETCLAMFSIPELYDLNKYGKHRAEASSSSSSSSSGSKDDGSN